MEALGLDDRGALWRRLDVLILQGCLWYDEVEVPTTPSLDRRRLSFSDRSIRVLIVRFHTGKGKEEVVALFLDVDSADKLTFLIATERIEFIGGAKLVEEEFRKEVAKREEVGLSQFEKRIASMIVFVDEDGKERRLLEG